MPPGLKPLSIAAASLVFLAAIQPRVAFADLGIDGGEVTQEIQVFGAGQSVTLIAGRVTTVRVEVAPGSVDVDIFDALLHMFDQFGNEISPPSPIRASNLPFHAKVNPDRNLENDLLNFELANPQGTNVTFSVEFIDGGTILPDSPLAFGQAYTFTNTIVPDLSYVEIDYRWPDAGISRRPNPDVMARGANVAMGIWPVPSVLYHPAAVQPVVFAQNVDDHDAELLFALGQIRRELIPTPTFLFGWLPENAFTYHGETSPSQMVAFGNSTVGQGEGIFAHEFGHALGFGHDNDTLGETGFDVQNLLGLGRIKLPTLQNIMTPGLNNDQRWVTPRAVIQAAASDVLSCSIGITGARASDNLGQILWISGGIRPAPFVGAARELTKGATGFLNPIFELQVGQDRDALCETQYGTYAVVVQDENGRSLVQKPFNVSFEVAPDRVSPIATFGVSVPESEGAAWVVLMDRKTGQVLDVIRRSAHPPEVFLMPMGDEIYGQGHIRWEMWDADGDALTASVEFSPDNGKSWVPLAVHEHGAEIDLDTQQLQATPDALIRVLVSDGFNTTVDTSAKLRVSHGSR
jgi:hypothetical protein